MQCFISLRKTALFLFFIMSLKPTLSTGTNEVPRRMVGGYSPANVRDSNVIEAAELVVRNLKEGQGPIERYNFEFPAGSGTSGNFEIKILDASQQVSFYVMFLLLYVFFAARCLLLNVSYLLMISRLFRYNSIIYF